MKKPDIFLITIDSLRSDFVNYEYMPNLMKLIERQGVASFDAFTAGMPTYYAFPSIMHGVYPFKFGKRVGVNKKIVTVSQHLRDADFSTLGISAGNAYTSSYAGYNHGFLSFEDFLRVNSGRKTLKAKIKSVPVLNAVAKSVFRPVKLAKNYVEMLTGDYYPFPNCRQVLSSASLYLQNHRESPNFSWIHLMDVHEPYLSEPKKSDLGFRMKRASIEPKRKRLWASLIKLLRSRDSTDPSGLIREFIEEMSKLLEYKTFLEKAYRLSVETVDEVLSEFINYYFKLHANTFFLITSDHGEEFFETSTYGHFPLFHNNQVVKIPFIIIGPHSSVWSNSLPELISTVDVFPTICDLAQINTPSTIDGISVFSSTAGERQAVYTESLLGVVPEIGKIFYDNANVLLSAHTLSGSTTITSSGNELTGSYVSEAALEECTKHLAIRKRRESLATILEKKKVNFKSIRS